MTPPLGQVLHSFFVSHLVSVKGLRPATIQSYRDALHLFLLFVAKDRSAKVSRLRLEDLTLERLLQRRRQPFAHATRSHQTRLRDADLSGGTTKRSFNGSRRCSHVMWPTTETTGVAVAAWPSAAKALFATAAPLSRRVTNDRRP